MLAALALGTNLGERREQLARALELLVLNGVLGRGMCRSSIYQSAAMLPEGAGKTWDLPFLNMVVCGETLLTPQELLRSVKEIERQMGRSDRGRWAPREIDIDILCYSDGIMQSDELVIPHPGLLERDFMLIPFAEILPQWRYPAQGVHHGKTAAELAAEMPCAVITDLRVVEAAADDQA